MTGPVAAFVYVKLIKREERWLRWLFWPVLISIHIAGFLFLLFATDELFYGADFITCLITPIFGVSSALGLRLAYRRSKQKEGDDQLQRGWINIGTVLIPLLQAVTLFWVAVLAPSV